MESIAVLLLFISFSCDVVEDKICDVAIKQVEDEYEEWILEVQNDTNLSDEEIEEEQPEFEETEIDQDTEMEEYEAEEEEEPEETNEVFEIFDVSEKASFPGGEEGLQRYLAENTSFPQMALENDQQGTVNVMFVVDKQGRVKNIQILGSKKGFGLEEEAIRVIKSTSGMWSPAKQRDKPVNMRFRIPVKFQIF